MNIFITGASGFIGGALARRLSDSGHRLTALARKPSSSPAAGPITWVEGDLSREDGLVAAGPALAAADAVCHLAAVRRDWSLSGDELRRVNVDSAPALLAAATNARRFLLVSSVAVYGHGHGAPLTEASPFAPSKRYGQSKVEAEAASRAAATRANVPLTIARPGIVFGPGDTYGMVANLARLLARRRFLLVGDGSAHANYLDVDDLAIGLEAALVAPDGAGEDFIFAGSEPVTISRLVATVAAAVGVRPPPVRVPEWIARAVAGGLVAGYRTLGVDSEPFLTRAKIDLFTRDDQFDTTKARQTLGFAPATPFTAGIERAVAWLRQAGELG